MTYLTKYEKGYIIQHQFHFVSNGVVHCWDDPCAVTFPNKRNWDLLNPADAESYMDDLKRQGYVETKDN